MEKTTSASSSTFSRLRSGTGRRRRSTHSNKLSGHVEIGSSVYYGSYARDVPSVLQNDRANPLRNSVDYLQLEPLLQGIDEDCRTFGIHEMRDGFFDATFLSPPKQDLDCLFAKARESLPSSLQPKSSSLKEKVLEQWDRLIDVLEEVTTTRAGIRLLKSFLGVFIPYVLCLVPVIRVWLGSRYNMLAVSGLFNHPGRSVGSQIDGALTTTLGVVVGLLWGSLAVWTTTVTPASARGYGAAILPFLVVFSTTLGWLRCYWDRFFQAIIASGIAFFYACLTQDFDVTEPYQADIWGRFTQFLVPWVLGQAICLCVCLLLFPAAGNRPLALAMHSSLLSIKNSLVLPRPESPALTYELSWHFVNLSQAVRDFMMDLSYSRYNAADVTALRNLLQAVLRAMLAVRPDTKIFNMAGDGQSASPDFLTAHNLAHSLGPPTWKLITTSEAAIQQVDSALMKISGHNTFSTKATSVQEMQSTVEELQRAEEAFDKVNASLAELPALTQQAADGADVLEFYLFVNPVRQAAGKIRELLAQTVHMFERAPRWRLNFPSYPWSKALFRMNPQVRHDRGGVTAASYFQTKRQLARMMDELQSRTWAPLHHAIDGDPLEEGADLSDQAVKDENAEKTRSGFRMAHIQHSIWAVMHRLQDFETRFALKKTLVCALLSIPAFLPQSTSWWYTHDSWWALATVWIMMHPRIGGNLQDLAIRTFCAFLGALWAGVSHAAGSGNSYVTAVMAAIFLVPMVYRYTLSRHPRSGVLGCLSFVVTSLIIQNPAAGSSIIGIVWTRGLAFVVGCVTAITVNWVLWPFVARHELRKSISACILHCALVYRNVIAKYMYYNAGEAPGKDDLMRSEMLEGRMREGFVRIRQLMELTRHEIRVRAPFDPVPYSALVDACEQFFDRLVDVRQASLFFHPDARLITNESSHNLLAVRRDAVATILMKLYILAGAMREQRPLPRYLPSAALARRSLLDAMELVEAEEADKDPEAHRKKRRWQDIYRYAYSGALTDLVAQVQQLEAYTRAIVGEIGLHRPNNQID